MFNTKIDLYLKSVWTLEPPIIQLTIDSTKEKIVLDNDKIFSFDLMQSPGKHLIQIEFNNKTNADSLNGNEKVVIVDKISFNNITSDQFVWQGQYYPEYPEPWYSQQDQKPSRVLKHCNYLGWNGRWVLEYSAPIFTWIHKVNDLGWIYGE